MNPSPLPARARGAVERRKMGARPRVIAEFTRKKIPAASE
jgi:hypothetical protein